MKFISQDSQEVKMVMFENTDMPDSTMQEVNGKKVFVKTGKITAMTTYTFRDGFGEKLIILSKDNTYRNLEGEMVDIILEVVFNDFQKRNRISLVSCVKAKSKSK